MKTIEEVIEAYEQCAKSDWEEGCGDCAYRNEKCGSCKCVRNDDALHYLKLFQKHADFVRGQLDDLKEEHRPNPALTWDELKTMEGKPVWVEEKYNNEWCGKWEVISTINDTEFWDEDEKNIWMTDEECRYKSNYGKTWQAYREERSDGLR